MGINYSVSKIDWNTQYNGWVGIPHFGCSNSSTGYHGILKQWWEHYAKKEANVLLVSEGSKVKSEFKLSYPKWRIKTTDGFIDDTDFKLDICSEYLRNLTYDLIISQATQEHLYDPFFAMKNMVNSLNVGGVLVMHTHSVACGYHAWPRDYVRFMDDWWYDMEKWLPVELLEFYNHNNNHVFACYKKK
jgi:hypothetical protein